MMDDRPFESLLSDALSRKGEPAPFDVDVAARVMERVAVLGVPRRIDIGYLARWSAAAAVFGLGLLVFASRSGPGFDAFVAALGLTTADLANAAAKLAAPAAAVAGAFGRVFNALLGSARTILEPLAPLQPVARVLIVLVTAGMLAITTFIVGRDVRRPASDQEHA